MAANTCRPKACRRLSSQSRCSLEVVADFFKYDFQSLMVFVTETCLVRQGRCSV